MKATRSVVISMRLPAESANRLKRMAKVVASTDFAGYGVGTYCDFCHSFRVAVY